tara:strand:- start:189 stop:524 length:336 start_codon:yes stop_codon:yes gene_type:complete
MTYSMKLKIARAIESFMFKYGMETSTRIYFSGKCWDYNDGKTEIKNIKASDYSEYSNDDTVAFHFEGDMYEVMNMYCGYKLYDEFDALMREVSGDYYFEMGHSWNCSWYGG